MIEALIVTAIVGLIWAAAASVLSQIPAQAAKWEESSALRQRARVIELRVGRIVASAGVIEADVDGRVVRVPAIWPRRLGATRPGAAGEVSARAATFFTRDGPQRQLTLLETLAASGGDVAALPRPGCGWATACGLREGDVVLVIAADGACGLYRVTAAGARIRVDGLMQQGSASFGDGAAVVPIDIEVITFDAEERALRRYDGYRSDNVMTGDVRDMSFDWPAGVLADGPFAGSGPLAYDVDQLLLRRVQLSVDLFDATGGSARRSVMSWNAASWR